MNFYWVQMNKIFASKMNEKFILYFGKQLDFI